jgi:hypothetical protein
MHISVDLNSHFTICIVSADHMSIRTLTELHTSVLKIQIVKFFGNEFELRSTESRLSIVISTRTTIVQQFQHESYTSCQI